MTRMTLIAVCILAAGTAQADGPDTCSNAPGATGSAQAPCTTGAPEQAPRTDTGTHQRLLGDGAEHRHPIVEKAVELKALQSVTAHQAAARAAVAVHSLRTSKAAESATKQTPPEPTTHQDDGYNAEIQRLLER